MEWLIGIICVVIVMRFWRIFLPLGVLAGVVLGGFLQYEEIQSEQRKKETVKAAQQLRVKIETAQRNTSSEGKEWKVYGDRDPASNKEIARTASITSNDGLCHLTVQKRIDGSELTGLDCPGIRISENIAINVKFDINDTSQRMGLSYGDRDDVSITSKNQFYGMSYQDFINGLVTAGAVAIEVTAEDGNGHITESFWVRFTLKGSTDAINQLGKEIKKR